jgi:diguanylate cyclase (GGDEF)-like protein
MTVGFSTTAAKMQFSKPQAKNGDSVRVYRPTLRTMLILAFVFTATMPLLVMTGWLYSGVHNRVMQEARDKNQLLSENLSGPVYQYLKAAQTNLSLLSAMLEKSAGTAAVSEMVSDQQYFTDFVLVSRSGHVQRLDGSGIAPSYGQMLNANPTIRYLLSKRIFGNSGIVRHPLTGRPTVFFLQPVGDQMLVGALDPEPIVAIGRHIHFGDRGHCAITDQFGNVVLHPNSSWINEVKSIADWPIVQAGLQGKHGVMTFFSPFIKEDMIAGFAPVPEFNWVILTPQPLSELTADARTLLKGGILFGALGLGSSLMLALFLANWIARPIGTLTQGLERIRKNDYSGSFDALGRVAAREIEALRHCSVHMADSIRTAVASRDELNDQLEQRVEQATKELIEANAKLSNQVHVDELTQLKNRRALWEHLSDLARSSPEAYLPMQAMLFDVDNFKQINDNYGHDTGDHVLTHVARMIEAHTRESDLVVRYGGDEFLAVLPNCSAENANRRAESIRQTVISSPLIVHGHNVRVTLSIGISDMGHTASAPNFSALLQAADRAMYHSKHGGRNRVSRI